MIRVLIADDSELVSRNLARRLELEDDMEVCGIATDGEAAVREALWLRPDIAVIDSGLPGMDGGQTTEMLTQSLPATGVIMISMEAENDAYRLAMLAGAREFLKKPFRGDELVAAVRRVHAFGQRRAGVAVPVATPAQAHAPRQGRVTAVVAGKGGVGKTVVAVNLAAALAARAGRRVVLVDLSLEYGDVGTALSLKPVQTMADLLEGDRASDWDAVSAVLTEGPAGLRVLHSPLTTDVAAYIEPADIRNVVETLRLQFDDVVLDTATHLGPTTVCAAQLADRVVVVTDVSAPGLKNTGLVTAGLRALEVDPSRVVVVVNHGDPAGRFASGATAAGYLGAPITAEIPYEPRVVAASIRRGVPFVVSHPSSRPARVLHSIAETVSPVSQGGSERHNAPATSDTKAPRRRRLALRA